MSTSLFFLGFHSKFGWCLLTGRPSHSTDLFLNIHFYRYNLDSLFNAGFGVLNCHCPIYVNREVENIRVSHYIGGQKICWWPVWGFVDVKLTRIPVLCFWNLRSGLLNSLSPRLLFFCRFTYPVFH